MKILIVILASLILYSGQAFAVDELSGNALFEGCRLQDGPKVTTKLVADSAYCGGVVATVLGLASAFTPQYRFCPPKGVNTTQAMKVLVKYWEQHPEHLNMDIRALSLFVFQQTWPCKAS